MPNYKLYYFNVRGRGELARLVLNYAGVPFEDCRFEMADWPAIKPKMPFGQVPVLEIDGSRMLAQSHTIARHLARQHGLAGQNDWDQAAADMYVDCIYDLHAAMRAATWEKDADKQRELFDKVNRELIQPHVERVEKQLTDNATGFLVGNAVTWADLAYFAYFTTPIMTKLGGAVLDSAPTLKKLVQHVGEIPQIKKYVDSRPVTSG